MPLSLTFSTPGGMRGAKRSDVSSVTSNVVRSRLLTPTIPAPASIAFASSRSSCTDDSSARVDCLRQFPFVVHLDQRRHPIAGGRHLRQPANLARGQDGRNQQDGVRAASRRFRHVIFVEREILPQHRQSADAARRRQVRQAALKKRFVGQHGKRRRASSFILLGQPRRIEIRRQQSFTGRGFLDLGNDGRCSRGQRPPKIPPPSARLFRLPLPLFTHTWSRRGTLPLVSDNTGQYVWNGFGQFDLW